MKRAQSFALLFTCLLATSGCTVADAMIGFFGEHYTVTDLAPDDRHRHFENELERWDQYQP